MYQPVVVDALRQDGHTVYDFRNAAAFSWCCIDENWMSWNVDTYLNMLTHPKSIEGFSSDFKGVLECEAGVLILPCGLSSGIEAGIIYGQGKFVAVYVPEILEPELMIKAFDFISSDLNSIRLALK